jgi:hypothetical protein
MQELLEKGQAIDLKGRWDNDMQAYDVTGIYVPDVDYCDSSSEAWIWSIGKSYETGKIWAALSAKFYQNDKFECLWLR